ncbi:MAG TPA: hypothetical protein VF861_09885 [Telluria sp.]
MKPFALAAMLALFVAGAGPACAVELIELDSNAAAPAAAPALPEPAAGELSRFPLGFPVSSEAPAPVVAPVTGMSELPEPEVLLMMLLGMCLIGYRASRVSDEKFK